MTEKCKRCRELENEVVLQNEIFNAISEMVTDCKEPSDFMLSFPIVREVWELLERVPG